VALASYFLEVNRKLENPKIIELKLFEETQASAHRDELTGLHNYRFFNEFLRCQVGKAERSNSPLSLVMIDVDDFKFYNDRNGHEAGNTALREAAQLLTEGLHDADLAARYGGEEFGVILPSTSKQDAENAAERIRAAVELHAFAGEHQQPAGTLTVSIGVATSPGDAREMGDLVRRADQAMYSAKAEGKNRVRLFGESLRSFRRIEADVEGSLLQVGSEPKPVTCVNLSEGGIRFLSDRAISSGTLTEVSLELPDSHGRVPLTCRVVDELETSAGRHLVGARILDMAARDQRNLRRYLEAPGSNAVA
jgi:diguanylate cyclase (GGDEF)-like protein